MGPVTVPANRYRPPARDAGRPAGFRSSEFVGALVRAWVVFLVVTPVLFVSAFVRPWTQENGADQVLGILAVWPWFALISALVVAVPGWPVALGVAALLRSVRSPVVHLLAHGSAAAAVAGALGWFAAGAPADGEHLIEAATVLGSAWWPIPVAAVVSTEAGWLWSAASIGRSDARRTPQVRSSSRTASESTAEPSSGSGRA